MEYKDFAGEKYRDIADAFGAEDAYTAHTEKVRRGRRPSQADRDLKNPTTSEVAPPSRLP